MDCNSCAPSERPDRPHTFLMHLPGTCPQCNRSLEARIVERAGTIVALSQCPACGPGEALVSARAKEWLEQQLGQGATGDTPFKTTTSTCPTCLDLLEAEVVLRDGKAWFRKQCPRCGPSEALVSEDAEYYVNTYRYARAGTQPHVYSTPVSKGCPSDCGLCDDHEQHTCLPIIEITDHCNLECPVCIVDNQYAHHLSLETFQSMIDRLVAHEGQCESVALSGGEPTSHPRLLELIDIATRPEIGRVVVITNGLRLGRDRALAEALKARGAYIGLQMDGFDARTHTLIRGRDLCQEKAAALDMIDALELPTQLIFVAARGINEDQIGRAVSLLLSKPWYLSLNFQPLAFTGQGGGRFAHDPKDRLTTSGVIRALAAQTDGLLRETDLSPLPCSHPQCVSLSYLLTLNDGRHTPFSRFVDFTRHGALLRSSATLGASPEIHEALLDVIHDVFARQDEIEDGPAILQAMRRTLDVMFPERPLTPQEAVRAGEGQAKSIFIHHYMDAHNFDLERLRKCCHHYPQVDGRIMPACGFNLFHRGAGIGPDSPRPTWARGGWNEETAPTSVSSQDRASRQALTGERAPRHMTPGTSPADAAESTGLEV